MGIIESIKKFHKAKGEERPDENRRQEEDLKSENSPDDSQEKLSSELKKFVYSDDEWAENLMKREKEDKPEKKEEDDRPEPPEQVRSLF